MNCKLVVFVGMTDRPWAEEAEILLIEPRGTPNTGDADAEPGPEREI